MTTLKMGVIFKCDLVNIAEKSNARSMFRFNFIANDPKAALNDPKIATNGTAV